MSTYLRNVVFSGDTIVTTVTTEPSTVSRWISETRSMGHQHYGKTFVGLDVEWRPSFAAGEPQNPVATVQICVDRRCLIYQIFHSEYIPRSLADFLSDHDFVFCGVGVQTDLEKLAAQYGIGRHARVEDLGKLAADNYNEPDLKHLGLKQLARLVLMEEMDKPRRVTMSRWDNRWLTDEQVEYACIDAFVSFMIGWVLNVKFV